MDGLFVAGAVLAAVQFWRRRDRRLAVLSLMLAFLAGAEARESWDPWRRRFQAAALASGLGLVALLSMAHDARGSGGRRAS
jgi:hypothetical protein